MSIDIDLNGNKLVLDDLTGGILSLQEKEGTTLIDTCSNHSGIIDVACPLPNYGPLRLASRFSKVANIVVSDNSVHISYNSLSPSRTDLGYTGEVSVLIKISEHPDGKSLVFEAEVDNQSDYHIPQVLFPDFMGLVAVSGHEHTWFRQGGVKVRPFIELGGTPTAGVHQFWKGGWWECFLPGKGWWGGTTLGRWSHFGSLRAGLGVFDESWYPDPEHAVLLRVYESTGKCRMCFSREMQNWKQLDGKIQTNPALVINPGAQWKSASFVVTPHAGGWPHGITTYRKHVQSHDNDVAVPAKHVQDEIGFRTVFMAETQEYAPQYCEYKWNDLPKVAAECKEHGISEINSWGGLKGFSLPMQLIETIGTKEEFGKSVDECRKLGVNVSLIISVVTCDPETSLRFGGSGKQSEGWNYHTQLIPAMNPGYFTSLAGDPMDTCNQAWQDAVLESIDSLREIAPISICWDQLFFSKGQRDLTYVIREILKKTCEKDPLCTFSAESFTWLEMESRYVHYTWNWRSDSIFLCDDTSHRTADYAAPALSVWKAPRLNLNVETDRIRIIKGFTDNFYLNFMMRKPDKIWGSANFHDYPETSELVKKLSLLRKKFLRYFKEGINLGDGVMADDYTVLHTSAYLLPDSLLFFVLNNTNKVQRSVKLGINIDRWMKCHEYGFEILQYDIDANCVIRKFIESVDWRNQIDIIESGELIIFEIREDTAKCRL